MVSAASLAFEVLFHVDQLAQLMVPGVQMMGCDIELRMAGSAGHDQNVPRRQVANPDRELETK
ncbi:hypothetical protein [Loktanella sp. M215]|uniref:hypothetical protein n=1 Tax=Loktanella sp. M215 TaxID=2675431 RepID=UPI001F40FBB5|nr:hypothetical protein [Loktanella sp. M215]MCF7701548.1 hypothetical protein [Loktanella sp. M215]|tara:strand:- start:48 stop:236 length:189 start_codon:yes stop_codon:yes gene_type:complete